MSSIWNVLGDVICISMIDSRQFAKIDNSCTSDTTVFKVSKFSIN